MILFLLIAGLVCYIPLVYVVIRSDKARKDYYSELKRNSNDYD